MGSFSYTSHAGFIYKWGGVLLHIPYWLYFYLGSFSYTSHACFLWGEFLLHIPCWLFFFLSLMWGETQAYTSRAGFIFISGVSLTHPMLASFPFLFFFFFFFFFFSLGSFSNTLAGFFFFKLFFYWLYLDRPCWLFKIIILGSFYYTSRAGFHVWGVSLTHPMLVLYLSGEFLIHIPFWLHFYLGSFSYTSHACFK